VRTTRRDQQDSGRARARKGRRISQSPAVAARSFENGSTERLARPQGPDPEQDLAQNLASGDRLWKAVSSPGSDQAANAPSCPEGATNPPRGHYLFDFIYLSLN